MRDRGIIVIDIGKTVAKAILCAADGTVLARRERANDRPVRAGLHVLDAAGIEEWLAVTLRALAALAPVGAIVPVAHGAAAAVIRDGRLAMAPLDYEQPLPPADLRAYRAERDPFDVTGSPALPDGLNLGAQFHLLERLHPALFDEGALIVPWPQYWAWLLSGTAASETSSFGSHSDLWCPLAGRPSPLAVRRGWARRFAPLHPASAILGPILPKWAALTGLDTNVAIHCGAHDSNAALVAARAFPQMSRGDATLLSTGTWFVAMRTPVQAPGKRLIDLDDGRDCLVNVDVAGRPVPSARFMGGREIALLTGESGVMIDGRAEQQEMLAALPAVLACGAMALPTTTPGVGPFPHGAGGWHGPALTGVPRAAAIALYAALVADAALDQIGSRAALLVEGRFARSQPFVRALATLRPGNLVYGANMGLDMAFGACRIANPALRPPGKLTRIAPLPLDLAAYRTEWRIRAEQGSVE
jgi:sugar (pentulose or hexulose) kinase